MTLIPTIDDVPPADYTADMIDRDLHAIAAQYPTNRNPVGEHGGCVYRAGEGMCLIGMWLELRGHQYLKAWDTFIDGETPAGAHHVLSTLDYPDETQNAALGYQIDADARVYGGPIPWGDVFPAAR